MSDPSSSRPPNAGSNKNTTLAPSFRLNGSSQDNHKHQQHQQHTGSLLDYQTNKTPIQQCSPAVLHLIGFQDFSAFEDVDLPSFVHEHRTTLTFPQKVSLTRASHRVWVSPHMFQSFVFFSLTRVLLALPTTFLPWSPL